MLTRFSAKQYLMLGTALTGVGALLSPTAALADCVAGAGSLSNLVTCDSPGGIGTNGYNTTNAGVTIQVLSTGIVNPPPAVGAPLLSAGSGSVVNNFGGSFNNGANTYGIDSGGNSIPAITLGGGSTVNNTSNASIEGSINFGSATGTACNTFNNSYSAAGGVANLPGEINWAGNTVINTQGSVNGFGSHTFTH